MYDTQTYKVICDKADAAGQAAVEKLQVVPMVVGQETSFTNTSTISYNLGSSKIHSLVYNGKDYNTSCYTPVLNLLDAERMTN